MNTDLRDILEALGYLRETENWHPLAETEADRSKIEGVVGVYNYRTSPNDITKSRPAVCVAEAQSEETAREIHRKVWNRGDCPFLIIVLPTRILMYSGFSYETDKSKTNTPLFPEIARTAKLLEQAVLRGKLRHFSSESIDRGSIWQECGNLLFADRRIDKNLLHNLQKLSKQLQSAPNGLAQEAAHSLIGKYIYFRYLKDRGILSPAWFESHEIPEESVFGRQASLQGFERLSSTLQRQFNGEIFPLSIDLGVSDSVIRFIASVFIGDDPNTGQMVLDFGAYDFEYIPIELLSSIYEQFLHEQRVNDAKNAGSEAGAYYTPKALADYVLSELQIACPLTSTTKAFDPSCGSGVFLVLAYQRMINLREKEVSRRLTAEELRDILTDRVFGVEINPEACSITEFSLLLTLLSYLEPRDLHQNEGFHFPRLRGVNIFEADFFAADNPVLAQNMRFDWIAGNPPWIRYSRTKSAEHNKEAQRKRAIEYIDKANEDSKPVGDLRACEAFCWRAGDLLTGHGHAALLIHATSLMNQNSSEFRKAFFAQMTVKHITNFSNLAYVLFENSDAPAAVVVYTRAEEDVDKPSIVHFAPFWINQKPLQKTRKKDGAWTITINESEIQLVLPEDAEKDQGNLWKICLWGTFHDRRALERLHRILPTTVGEVTSLKGYNPASQGLWLCEEADPKSPQRDTTKPDYKYVLDVKYLNDKKKSDKKKRLALQVPPEAIKPLDMSSLYVERGQTKEFLYKGPHLFVNASFALFSEDDFVIPKPQVGIACPDKDFLKSLCVFLNSSVAKYILFFGNGPWGVTNTFLLPSTISECAFQDLSPNNMAALSKKYDDLVEKDEVDSNSRDENILVNADASEAEDLQEEIDSFIGEVLGVPAWITTISQEFMRTRYQLNKGKMGNPIRNDSGVESQSPVSSPTEAQLRIYGEHLRETLNSFSQMGHKIAINREPGTVMASVEITGSPEIYPIEVTSSPSDNMSSLMHAVRDQRSQWIYVQRSIRYFEGESKVHLLKSDRLLDWTQTQAFLDAGEIIGNVLSGGK